MAASSVFDGSPPPASHVLGRKLDSVQFSLYHVVLIVVLGFAGFIKGVRCRGHFFGESSGRVFAGVIVPFLLEPYTGSPTVFFGTMVVVVAAGAFIPVLFDHETSGNLETFTEAVPELT